MASGSKINRELFSMKQDGKSRSQYYIVLKDNWEEIEIMSNLPPITRTGDDIVLFLKCLAQQQDEQR